MSATALPDNVKSEVRNCTSGDANIDVKGNYALKFVGCIESRTKLEPQVRDTLNAIAIETVSKVLPAEVEAYTKCRYASESAASGEKNQ